MANERRVGRRAFGRTTAAALGAFTLPTLGGRPAAAQQAGPAAAPDNSNVTLQSELLMDLVLDVAPAQDLGPRQIVPVTGGVVLAVQIERSRPGRCA